MKMELNVKKMMTEMVMLLLSLGLFWCALADGTDTGMGLAGIIGVVGLTVAWMAFKGADILPFAGW